VLLGSRDATRGDLAVKSILAALGEEGADRIELVTIDVSSDTSVQDAAAAVSTKFGTESLYAIVNNAAVGFDHSIDATLQTNVYGTMRVTNAFMPLLQRSYEPQSTGRIVNIASASGPLFVAKLNDAGIDTKVLTDASVTQEQVEAYVKHLCNTVPDLEQDAYGLSKACVNVYTMQLAKQHPDLLINSCTPGFIATDMTQGLGATNTPEMGTVSAMHCLFSPDVGTGQYFGSDARRSPLDRYRAPGDAPYEP
jgi:carbonyl reductase 1